MEPNLKTKHLEYLKSYIVTPQRNFSLNCSWVWYENDLATHNTPPHPTNPPNPHLTTQEK